MKLVVLALAAFVAVALAAPVDNKEQVPIVRSEFERQPEGAYNYAFETGDGTKKEEVGEVKTLTDEDNKPVEVVVVRGQYSYVDEDGKSHSFTYTADENGFHVESDDIPKAQA